MNSDLYRIAQGFQTDQPNIRLRFGTVVSVQSDYTCTVTLAGSTEPVSGVRYLSSFVPTPDAAVLLLTDGVDLFAFGQTAGTLRGLAVWGKAYRGTAQAVATGTDVSISFSASEGSYTVWSNTNATRLLVPVPGVYVATAQVEFDANATGNRSARIVLNGTTTVARVQVQASPTLATFLSVASPVLSLTPTDYLELSVRQTSGVSLNAATASTFFPSLSLAYVGP